MPLDIKIRGIRSPVPSGHVLGRLSPGEGDVELIDIQSLSGQVGASIAGSGGTGGGAGSGGITQLTGDVTAGPGVGSVVATLSTTGVTAGTYYNATITVDAKGRISAAASGGMLPLVNGDTGPPGFNAIGDGSAFVGVPL